MSERATFEQSYDVGPEGRFGGQKEAAELVMMHPLGTGALEFARVYHNEDVHEVYFNMYLNTGWVGGALYLFLVFTTLVLGLTLVLRGRGRRGERCSCGGILRHGARRRGDRYRSWR